MNLWDHLCTILRARVVSTEDVSSKVRALMHHPCKPQVQQALRPAMVPLSVPNILCNNKNLL